MSSQNKNQQSFNIFEKYYLQQTNKLARTSSLNRSFNTSISSLSSSFQTNNIDINVELEFYVSYSKIETLRIINEIEVEENTENNIYSMVIYFVKPEDTLWKIAKRFKTTVEEIAKVNNIARKALNEVFPIFKVIRIVLIVFVIAIFGIVIFTMISTFSGFKSARDR